MPRTGRPRKLDERRILDLLNAGASVEKIAQELGAHRNSIYYVLKQHGLKPPDGLDKNHRWRKKNRDAGLCERCGGPRDAEWLLCSECHGKVQSLGKRKNDRRRDYCLQNAICWSCGEKHDSGMLRCAECRRKSAEYQRERYRRVVQSKTRSRVEFTTAGARLVGTNDRTSEIVRIPVVNLTPNPVEFWVQIMTEPTQALPGSAEKIAILEERYAQGLPLFIDEDFQTGLASQWEDIGLDREQLKSMQAVRGVKGDDFKVKGMQKRRKDAADEPEEPAYVYADWDDSDDDD